MVILRHRLPGGWLRSIEDRLKGPQISIAHDLAERFFDFQESSRGPARRHSGTPAANTPRAIANPGMRIVHDVAGSQTTMQRAWKVEPVWKHSSSPSSNAAATAGYSCCSQPAIWRNLAIPSSGFIFQAARINDAV